MNLQTIDQILYLHPNMYNAVKELVLYDAKVYFDINSKYGVNTLDNIIKTNEFHSEIDNVSKGIKSDTKMNRLAQKRHIVFQRYLAETGKVAQSSGFKETMQMIDALEKYFKQLAPILI
jgi:hypothetical protein